MINSLELKNFRKHTDANFKFGAGLTVLRGENEIGKTTIAEGILYALFGASALREPLADVVTYGQPESTLKAKLEFALDGVDYKIVRGKSGAELTYSDQMVTGQKETRLFVEKLLGCTGAVAKMLMFADQNAVRGVLSEGAGAANSLVEKLAELSLIEELIDKVQSQLPSGNTKVLEGQIESLQTGKLAIPNKPSESEVTALTLKISSFLKKIDLLERSQLNDQEVGNAVARVEASNALQADLERLLKKQAEITATLARHVTTPSFGLADLQQARQDASNLPEQKRRWVAYNITLPACTAGEWDESLDAAKSFAKAKSVEREELRDKIAKTETNIKLATARKITEQMCAFCDKDLSDVPEVLKRNAAADAEVVKLKADLADLKILAAGVNSDLNIISEILEVDQQRRFAASEAYWIHDNSVPVKPRWRGAKPTPPGATQLPEMEKEWAAYQILLAHRQGLAEELQAISLPKVPDTEAEELLLAKYYDIEDQLAELRSEVQEAKQALQKAETALVLARVEREAVIRQNELTDKTIASLDSTWKAMVQHNDLIKKLRSARPEIAAKMWGTVLGAISRHFSQIRGEASVVTRDAGGFKVNGRGVAGLSGSTQDMLGLAIRISLSKLFLPAVTFMFLDEGFSGCDDNREMNGITTLSSAGFDQVIMVTHSDAAEPLASTFIALG